MSASRSVVPPVSSSKSSGVSSSLGIGASTRDAILARYAAGGGGAANTEGGTGATARLAMGSGSTGKEMECFESADPSESGSGSSGQGGPGQQQLRSDRSLLASSASSVGAGGAKKLASASGMPHSEDVDASAMKPLVAFQSFAGALYRGSSTSGGSGGSSGVFESGLSSSARFESPFARLQRLQGELQEFQTDLTAATAQQGKAGSTADSAWATLGASVAQLQGQLDSMLVQPKFKAALDGGASNDEATPAASGASSSLLLPQFDSLFSQYVAELQANPNFRPISSAPAAAAPSAASSSGELAALPKLDERLAVLEKFIGLPNGGAAENTSAAARPPVAGHLLAFGAPTAATAWNSSNAATGVSQLPSPDLVSSLSSLHAQLAALNPQRLEFIGRQLKSILLEQETHQLNAKQAKEEASAAAASASTATAGGKAQEKKEEEGAAATAATTGAAAASSPAYAQQVSHLYALVGRWDALALGLPALIARLSSLHTLHAASGTLQTRVAQLEQSTLAIDSALTAQTAGLAEMQKAAATNLAQLQANFHAMETRMEAIGKKMEQIRK